MMKLTCIKPKKKKKNPKENVTRRGLFHLFQKLQFSVNVYYFIYYWYKSNGNHDDNGW